MSLFGPPRGKKPFVKAAASVLAPSFAPQPPNKFPKSQAAKIAENAAADAVKAFAGTPIKKPVMSALLRPVSPPRDPAPPPRASSSAASDPAKSAIASRGANGRSITFKNNQNVHPGNSSTSRAKRLSNKNIRKLTKEEAALRNARVNPNYSANSVEDARIVFRILEKEFHSNWNKAQVAINSSQTFSGQFYDFLNYYKGIYPRGIPWDIYDKIKLPPDFVAKIKTKLS